MTRTHPQQRDDQTAMDFGCIPMPHGYSVVWDEGTEHYIGLGPDESFSLIVCCKWAARRWCIREARRKPEITDEEVKP